MSNFGFSIPTGGYDGEDRLVSFNRTSGLSQSWSLSPVGDWNSVTTNGTAQTRAHGPTHELLTGAGSNVSTDVKGNITLIPSSLRPNASSLTSVWDFDNRLTSATTGSTTVSHQYDAVGRRVARTSGSSTTVYVQAGQQTIADYASGAAPGSSAYRYLYASYIDEPVMRWTTSSSTPVYYHRNQQYSVTALTDASGSVLERYAYSAYGVPTFCNPSGVKLQTSNFAIRHTYTGREWDNDIQQYHYRARMYDPALGRFCSRDPIGYGDGNNPNQAHFSLSETDPSGMQVEASYTASIKNTKAVNCGNFGWNVEHRFSDVKNLPLSNQNSYGSGKVLMQKLCVTKIWTECDCPAGGSCKPTNKHHVCEVCFYEVLGWEIQLSNNGVGWTEGLTGGPWKPTQNDTWRSETNIDQNCYGYGFVFFIAEVGLVNVDEVAGHIGRKAKRQFVAKTPQSRCIDEIETVSGPPDLAGINSWKPIGTIAAMGYWTAAQNKAQHHGRFTIV